MKSLNCNYPNNVDRQPMVSPSQRDNVSLVQSDGSMDMANNMQSIPSNMHLPLSPQEGSNTQSSPYIENGGDTTMQQPQNFEYDLGPCDIDWDFPMNWLPYNNEIETNYCSILGLETNIASAGSINPSCGDAPPMNQHVSNFPVISNTPQTVSTVASVSQGSGVAASPQLSMTSDRTVPGDLYATSSNGARRPCTARSKQLFPPLGVEGCTQLSTISQDSSLRLESNSWAFPDLDHITIQDAEGFRESALTEATYAKIYDSFENTCLESGIFGNEFTSSEFPPMEILDYCIKLFFEHFNPIFPLVHTNTTDLNADWILTLAICAIGSQYSVTEDIDACVSPLQEFLRRVLVVQLQLENSEMDLALSQALVLSQVGLLHYGTSKLRQTAYQRVGDLHKVISLYRQSHTRSENDTRMRLSQRGTNIHEEWKLWVEAETLRRLCYFIWVSKTVVPWKCLG